MITSDLVETFVHAAASPDEGDLAVGALCLPRIEYHELDSEPSLAYLSKLGARAAARIARLGRAPGPLDSIEALNTVLFEEEGFTGNEARYDDPQNSFLNDVLRRRTGIPISLAVVYLDVARRANIAVDGVNFPGHFLVRFRPSRRRAEPAGDLIIDPFHRGALLSEADCRELLRKHLGEEASFDRRLLARADKRTILIRMLVNLKRLYVSMRSFPQARDTVNLLLALDPGSLVELRDRGLLSYHLQDFTAALRDLEAFLLAASRQGGERPDEETRTEYQQVWEHVKNLRRRLANFN